MIEEGLGGNWLAQRPPGSHTSQFGRGKPNVLKPGTISKAKSCFGGVPLLLETSPRPSLEPNSGILHQNVVPMSRMWSPGLKISKLRLKDSCRKQWSILQTEPYVARHGPKPLWGICATDYAQCENPRSMCRQGKQAPHSKSGFSFASTGNSLH